ncbi:hypothetical protein VZ95_10125 [Elstera litoralis]|uniref:Uncharacterized protein n=1 Tax=Elstera litoralis TaxID=552518 RepID=A0A0F3ISE7_9PROT|nr:hypothetical protein VZ95_10125 [Elstera litoralis]
MEDPQDGPHRDLALGLVPVAETLLAATDFKAIPPRSRRFGRKAGSRAIAPNCVRADRGFLEPRGSKSRH